MNQNEVKIEPMQLMELTRALYEIAREIRELKEIIKQSKQ